MKTVMKKNAAPDLPARMTARTAQLRRALEERAKGNRADDWLREDELPNLASDEPIIVRRAKGIVAVLEALTSPKISARTRSWEILPGELLVGVLPMGSNGLGKVFPDYLTPEERAMASLSNRSEFSIQGHNSADYERLVKYGMRKIIADAQKRLARLEARLKEPTLTAEEIERATEQRHFYHSVIISCQGVVDYARRYAELAETMAAKEKNAARKAELKEIARVCRKVPMEPAGNLHEALQSILFLQIGFRAGMDLLSLGRLDQTLQPFVTQKGQEADKALELLECMIIKLAGPTNLTAAHLMEQDHIDFGVSMGTSRWYSDQRGNVNQFLQNVVVGGVDKTGKDATCDATYLILQAFRNVNLSTPGIYVRLHKNSPKELVDRVAESIAATRNLPSVLNDEVIIPGFLKAFMDDETIAREEALELVRDYCVDGCWEPILNGQGDWTFNMVNGLTALECALNEGNTLDGGNMQLKGGKRSYRSTPVTNYKGLMKALGEHFDFITFQSAAAMYNYYLLDEYVTPAPLLSAFLGSCMQTGRDKSCGGCRVSVAGTVLSGLPNVTNSIAAIDKWVFKEKKYTIEEVREAFRNNFGADALHPRTVAPAYRELYRRLNEESPRYGTNDPEADRIAKAVSDAFFASLEKTKRMTDRIYREKPKGSITPAEARRLRVAGGFFGEPFDRRTKKTVAFTGGLGTFAAFTLMGMGCAASVDRFKDDPLSKNNCPAPGTLNRSFGHIFASLKGLGLERCSAGAPIDLTIDVGNQPAESQTPLLAALVESFVKNKGNVLSVTLGNERQFGEIHQIAVKAEAGDPRAAKHLLQYADVMVRAGGWQAPFITLSLAQQSHYLVTALAL